MGARQICPKCQWEMPHTGYMRYADNPVARKFWGLIPVVNASSLIFFSAKSPYRNMIHDFKYHGMWDRCEELGTLMACAIRDGGLYDDVDLIIPIPLHRRRMWKRGYNQSEYIAQGIARELNKELNSLVLMRTKHNPPQAQTTDKEGRWDNVKGIFTLSNAATLRGKHILLVDDVLTTGSTIISAAQTILDAEPTSRISVVTFAVSATELFKNRRVR